MQRYGPVARGDRRGTELRKVVIEHQIGIADAHVSMHQLAAGSRRSRNLHGIKCAFQKINIVRRSPHGEMRCQRAKTFGNGILCLSHSLAIVRQLAESGKKKSATKGTKGTEIFG